MGRKQLLAAAAAIGLLLPMVGLAQRDIVGRTGAVNPDATSRPPDAAERTLLPGQDITFNERIATGDTGQAHISFLDRSALTIGTDSDIRIDEFVFDPDRRVGRLAATMAKGAFRYVGGAISKAPDSVSFRMDSATIGIRGGMIEVAREPEGILAIFLAGNQMRVVGASREERVVQRPGDAVVIDPAGRVTRPFQITAEQRAKVLRRLSPNTPDAQPVDESRMHNGAPPLGVHGANGSVPVGSTSHPANETVTTPSGAAPPPTPGAARPKAPSLPLSRAPAPLRVSPSRPPVPPRKRRQLKSIAGKEQRSRARAFDAVCRRRRCR